MDSSRKIEDDAAGWLSRRESGEWAEADEVALGEWLHASARHRVEYLRLEAAWEQAQRLKALGAGVPARTVPPVGEWNLSPFFDSGLHPQPSLQRIRSPGYWAAAAASILVAIGAVLFFALNRGEQYVTSVGVTSTIPLQDGSNITLNTASKIRVDLSKQERLVKLEGGEAFFDVAQDPRRPFIVEAGNKRIVVVGTKFSVRREGSADIQVVVTEGRVRIEDRAEAKAGEGALLPAGTITHIQKSQTRTQTKTPQEAEESLSWRTGYLTFDAIPLGEAVAEFNRYNQRKIVIDDRPLAAIKISGKFRATNADAFIRILHDGFRITSEEDGNSIVLGTTVLRTTVPR